MQHLVLPRKSFQFILFPPNILKTNINVSWEARGCRFDSLYRHKQLHDTSHVKNLRYLGILNNKKKNPFYGRFGYHIHKSKHATVLPSGPLAIALKINIRFYCLSFNFIEPSLGGLSTSSFFLLAE
jgi:hypothetical protein